MARVIVLFLTLIASSKANYLDRKAEGWHWYEDPAVAPKETPPEKKVPEAQDAPAASPATVALETFKKQLQESLHLAIMQPTHANVAAYMQLQKAMLDRSELFSKRWMEVVYNTPELDYTVRHPVSQAARHIYLDAQGKALQNKIKALSKSYGLFFFFQGSCPYCHHFAPIVKAFAHKYGWDVMAISLDGSKLEAFPQAKSDNGAAKALGVEAAPTLLAVNPQTGKVIALSHGMISQEEIERRLDTLTQAGEIQ